MDIKCVVCGEPWDGYGVRMSLTASCGDMKYWEAQLFRQGAGCPGCKGVKPKEGGFDPVGISDFENGDEDELDRIHAWEDAEEGRVPPWKRPANKALWTCESCGARAVHDVNWHIDSEFGRTWELPRNSRASQSWGPYRFDGEDVEKVPTYILEQEKGIPVCPLCLLHCSSCDAPLGEFLEAGDGYEPGVVYYNQSLDRQYCMDCFASACTGCGEVEEECGCDDSAFEEVPK